MTNGIQAAAAAPLLRQPLVEFVERLTTPADLHKTLNRLVFTAPDGLLPDERENIHALFDFMLACQLATTVAVAHA